MSPNSQTIEIAALAAAADPGEWVAAPYKREAEAVTVGNFGDWRLQRATPGIPGGNYRDSDFGNDEANAKLAAALVNAYRAGTLAVVSDTRDTVLEEAANVCEELAPSPCGPYDHSYTELQDAKADGCNDCAEAIRALKKTAPQGRNEVETPASPGAPAGAVSTPCVARTPVAYLSKNSFGAGICITVEMLADQADWVKEKWADAIPLYTAEAQVPAEKEPK